MAFVIEKNVKMPRHTHSMADEISTELYETIVQMEISDSFFIPDDYRKINSTRVFISRINRGYTREDYQETLAGREFACRKSLSPAGIRVFRVK